MNHSRLILCTAGLAMLAALAACASPRESSTADSHAAIDTTLDDTMSSTSSSVSASTSTWSIPLLDFLDDTTTTLGANRSATTQPKPPTHHTTPPTPTYTWPTSPPAPPTTYPKEYTLTCWDGRTFIQWWPPNDDDRLLLCGPTPPSTLPPPPKVDRVSATFGSGMSWMANERIATPESCPTSTTITYTAYLADGSTESGSVPMSATPGATAHAPATLHDGQKITFSLYLIVGGGCVRGMLY